LHQVPRAYTLHFIFGKEIILLYIYTDITIIIITTITTTTIFSLLVFYLYTFFYTVLFLISSAFFNAHFILRQPLPRSLYFFCFNKYINIHQHHFISIYYRDTCMGSSIMKSSLLIYHSFMCHT
jgi:hypothetical protein